MPILGGRSPQSLNERKRLLRTGSARDARDARDRTESWSFFSDSDVESLSDADSLPGLYLNSGEGRPRQRHRGRRRKRSLLDSFEHTLHLMEPSGEVGDASEEYSSDRGASQAAGGSWTVDIAAGALTFLMSTVVYVSIGDSVFSPSLGKQVRCIH